METVMHHAARLARESQGDVARLACYALTCRCVRFCEAYGAHDIFPSRPRCGMLQGDWAPEMMGIEEPLMEVWGALGL